MSEQLTKQQQIQLLLQGKDRLLQQKRRLSSLIEDERAKLQENSAQRALRQAWEESGL